MVQTSAAKAARPVFPHPPRQYDFANESAFRREVERFMEAIAETVVDTSSLPYHASTHAAGGVDPVQLALTDLTNVTETSVAIGDYLRASAQAGGLTRSTSGLLAQDSFNRANEDPITGWSEEDAGNAVGSGSNLVLNTNRIAHGNVTTSSRLTRAVAAADTIVQWIAGPNSTGAFGVVNFIRTSDSLGYIFYWDQSAAQLKLTNEVTAFQYDSDSAPAIDFVDKWAAMRLVVELSGGNHLLRGYVAENVGGGENDNDDLTLRVSGTESSSPLTGTHAGGILGWYIAQGDHLFVCGRNIVVNGLPTGYKVKVDSRASVTESGGSVTINVDTWALPATTLKVLNTLDIEVDSITPSGGIYGGDVYTFTGTPGDWVNVTISQLISDLDTAAAYLKADGSVAATGQLDFQAGLRTDTISELTPANKVVIDGTTVGDGGIIIENNTAAVWIRDFAGVQATAMYVNANDALIIGDGTYYDSLHAYTAAAGTIFFNFGVNNYHKLTSTYYELHDGSSTLRYLIYNPSDTDIYTGTYTNHPVYHVQNSAVRGTWRTDGHFELAGSLLVDNIVEKTASAGVTIDAVLVKDGWIESDTAPPAGTPAINLRGGDTGTVSANRHQIALGYYGGSKSYRHVIRTRHNAGAATLNSIDFFLWNYGVDAVGDLGTFNVARFDAAAGLMVDNIIELTATSGVTVEGVLLKDSFAQFGDATGLVSTSTTGTLRVSGSQTVTTGSNMVLYGESHATNARDFLLRSATTNVMQYDSSAEDFYFNAIGLELSHASSPYFQVQDTTNFVTGILQATDSIVNIGSTTNHTVQFLQNNITRMTIGTNSNVHILNTLVVDTISEYTTDAGVGVELVHFRDGNMQMPAAYGYISRAIMLGHQHAEDAYEVGVNSVDVTPDRLLGVNKGPATITTANISAPNNLWDGEYVNLAVVNAGNIGTAEVDWDNHPGYTADTASGFIYTTGIVMIFFYAVEGGYHENPENVKVEVYRYDQITDLVDEWVTLYDADPGDANPLVLDVGALGAGNYLKKIKFTFTHTNGTDPCRIAAIRYFAHRPQVGTTDWKPYLYAFSSNTQYIGGTWSFRSDAWAETLNIATSSGNITSSGTITAAQFLTENYGEISETEWLTGLNIVSSNQLAIGSNIEALLAFFTNNTVRGAWDANAPRLWFGGTQFTGDTYIERSAADTLNTPDSLRVGDKLAVGLNSTVASDRIIDIDGYLNQVTSYGVVVTPISQSSNTSAMSAIYVQVTTQDAAYTLSNLYNIYIADASKGASMTITNAFGLRIADITTGTTNYAIYTGTGTVRFGDTVLLSGDMTFTNATALNFFNFVGTSYNALQVDADDNIILGNTNAAAYDDMIFRVSSGHSMWFDVAGTYYVKINASGVFTDSITEYTAAAGVTIEGVLLKDSEILLDNSKTIFGEIAAGGGVYASLLALNGSDHMVLGDVTDVDRTYFYQAVSGIWVWNDGADQMFLDRANGLRIDVVNELTAAAGVTIDGVLLKDGIWVSDNAKYHQFKDFAGTAQNVFGVDAGDNIILGSTSLDDFYLNIASAHTFRLRVGGTDHFALDTNEAYFRVDVLPAITTSYDLGNPTFVWGALHNYRTYDYPNDDGGTPKTAGFAVSYSDRNVYFTNLGNSSSIAMTFTGITQGKWLTIILRRSSNSGGMTWPSEVDWGTAGAPTIPTTAGDALVVRMYAHSATEVVAWTIDTFTLADI